MDKFITIVKMMIYLYLSGRPANKFLPQCGSGVVSGARFCGKLGNRLWDIFE